MPEPNVTTGPTAGEMFLHPEIRPGIRPGRYTLGLEQTFTVGGTPRTVQTETHHLEVTGPRVSMPGTELFSVSPPPNAEGPFAGRLAQVALRRRTLPWERSEPMASGPPWLALVVLADEEADYLPGVATADAFTQGVAAKLDGLDAAPATCDAIEVLDEVVARTFPAREELAALCHVRQVSLADTEYADEDGFVSVVIANRLPQPSTRYAAYLISVEGQLDELPEPGTAHDDPGPAWVYELIVPEWAHRWHQLHDVLPEGTVGPVVHEPGPTVEPTQPGVATPVDHLLADATTVLPSRTLGAWTTDAVTRHEVTGHEVTGVRAGEAMRRVDTTGDASVGGVASAAGAVASSFVSHALDHAWVIDKLVKDLGVPAPRRLRFPVLARWEFTCTAEDRDFAGYMTGLDVALLGSEVAEPPEDVRPLRATATGHVPLTHRARSGRDAAAWYRGPFAPAKVTRGPAQPLHHADQARRLVPDEEGGTREDLGEAAAFELGRLLAMADLSFVTGVRRLVSSGFRDPQRWVLEDQLADIRFDRFDPDRLRDLSRLLAFEVLLPDRLGADPRAGFGTVLPPHDLVTMLDLSQDVGLLAEGLGISKTVVEQALGGGLTSEITRPGVVDRPGAGFEDLVAGRAGIGDLATVLTRDVGERVGDLAVGRRVLADAGIGVADLGSDARLGGVVADLAELSGVAELGGATALSSVDVIGAAVLDGRAGLDGPGSRSGPGGDALAGVDLLGRLLSGGQR